ncbi:AAA family ATPase [Rhizobium sp. BK376]|uniref:AAA family ATPase n=1 Tax=Rhizobium sp. BK376 TaxID=2512149 RepID=UPI0010E01118|nr:AAA family ATPase [Rhizobium sp. BK376]TCR76751.1 exodeoxyribonuclease V alpha subunit [Rhizobium sp. BK376]
MNTAAPPSAERTLEMTVTSVHPSLSADYVLIGRDQADRLVRALVPGRIVPKVPVVGEVWRLSGAQVVHPLYGEQTDAVVALPLLPTGRAIVRYLAVDSRFPGVGWATAELLWSTFGTGLYGILEREDSAALAAVCGPELASLIVSEFGAFSNDVYVFRELDRYGVSARTAGAAARLWGRGAVSRIRANPYTIALLESWKSVDGRALRMGVLPGDARRLVAAVEEALSRALRFGHMLAPSREIARATRALLGSGAADARRAVAVSIGKGSVVGNEDGMIQLRGCEFMEREIEGNVRERIDKPVDVSGAKVGVAISNLEAEVGFALTGKQREAVFMACGAGIAAISGAAGTGKTAVLRAIIEAVEQMNEGSSTPGIRLVALAGRAARRMSLSTNREAWTLSRLLTAFDMGLLMEEGLVVFDEASMLDSPSIYRVMSRIGTNVRVLFVGDPGQLPPIGPGMPFHKMVGSSFIPHVKLDVIHRHAESTGIPRVASRIRLGTYPDFGAFDFNLSSRPGVFFIPCPNAEVPEMALKVLRSMVGPPPRAGQIGPLHSRDVQILTQTNHGAAGARDLSRAIEWEYMKNQEPIEDFGFHAGSRLLWVRNDYRKAPLTEHGKHVIDPRTGQPQCAGFFNGSLGVPKIVDGRCLLTMDDGSADFIGRGDLEKLTFGWAITVHKAQGSSFNSVIIPIVPSPLLDRTMIYTAVTRAEHSAVLVGDPDALRQAIEAAPRAASRGCGLDFGGNF